MLDARRRPQPRRPASPREFFLPVEVYISNKAATALRKPNPRKKAERRDSSRPLSMLSDDNQRKVKEKTSWLNLARVPNTGDQWKQATCRLAEEGEGCVLNVYIEEAILFQSVYLHLLYHTDIRPADQSLLFRKDCLGIHCSEDQRWSATRSTEPLYFAFPSTDILNAWTALLRSYAAPEIYGISSSQRGGSYRIWRQVEVTCVQGLNLGVHRPLDPTPNTNTSTDTEGHGDAEAVDLDLFCEVYVNSVLSGRTVVKKSVGSPDWHEIFTFTDLPPFERLAVVVWREKKLQKPSIIGTVYITLTNFRRGEHVEGWFPVLSGGSTAPSTQVGKLRLKIRVDEEIVLPYSEYSKVIDTLDRRNYLEWMSDLDVKLKMRRVSPQLVSIAVAKDVLLINVFEMADREVDGTPSSHHTLFRGNTVLTKTIESLMGWYGKGFLEASVGQTIRRLCLEGVAIEVDPARHSKAKGPKDIEKNVDLLVHWCREIWDQIFSVRMQCPDEMRQLFEYIRELVERRYRTGYNQDANNELPRQSVSAFCFLRFIVPAILHPHLFGLCSGLPDLPVQRSLTLIAKVIQSLANLNAAAPKEDFMRGVMSFVEEKLPEMLDYILVVSTPGPKETPQPQSEEAQDRYRAIKALQERKQAMYDLQREAIPPLPHFLDIPRHLAIVTSSIVRSARSLPVPQDPDLADLYERCRDVEQQALYYVSCHTMPRMAATPRTTHQPQGPFEPNLPAVLSNCNVIEVAQPLPPSKPRRSSSSPSNLRPKTAPSGAMSDPSLPTSSGASQPPRDLSASEVDASTMESATELPNESGSWPARKRQTIHQRSASIDSIPEFRNGSQGEVRGYVQALHPHTDDQRRKKGFLRNILVRK